MQLILFRHGTAAGLAPGGSDDERPLTQSGADDFREAAAAWGRILPTPQCIWVSPLLRAQQTAQIFCDVLGLPLESRVEPELRPEGRVERVLELLPEEDVVVAFTHMPLVGELVGRILSGRSSCVPMSTGSGVWIELPSHFVHEGRLITALDTDAARRLGAD